MISETWAPRCVGPHAPYTHTYTARTPTVTNLPALVGIVGDGGSSGALLLTPSVLHCVCRHRCHRPPVGNLGGTFTHSNKSLASDIHARRFSRSNIMYYKAHQAPHSRSWEGRVVRLEILGGEVRRTHPRRRRLTPRTLGRGQPCPPADACRFLYFEVVLFGSIILCFCSSSVRLRGRRFVCRCREEVNGMEQNEQRKSSRGMGEKEREG